VANLLTYNQNFTIGSGGSVNLTGIVELEGYVQASLMVIAAGRQAPANVNVQVGMGKYSQLTVAQQIDSFPLGTGGQIRVYNVTGPELEVLLQGPVNTVVSVQMWVYLR
jgi:hypothetical protein